MEGNVKNMNLPYYDLLTRITSVSRRVLSDSLVGVYLHGSAAMGCFNPNKSDLDLILVVNDTVPDADKLEILRHIVPMNEEAPPKGIELSIVKREYCDPFAYPTPYELHFSPTHIDLFRDSPYEYISRLHGTDRDLAAHFTIINKYGIVLYGEPVDDIFGDVPARDYIDSICFDVENARDDIMSNPLYVTLNLCRVLAYLRDELVMSKKDGGEWGLRTLPHRYHTLIADALRCYDSEAKMSAHDIAVEFAEYALGMINAERMKNT